MKLSLPNVFFSWLITWFWWVSSEAQDVCTPCADGLDAFLVGGVCESGIALAANLTSATEECNVLQLALYQGDCCDTPPEDYCTLCENGSQVYNLNKVIPAGAGDPPFEVTCENYATRAQYVREGATGICSDTERARARSWCECDGIQPVCTLTCNDGNPPPDLTKTDLVLGDSCERFVYEFTTLSTEECANSSSSLNFDAKAFCCEESPPNHCSVCSAGQKLADPSKVVQTEFYGSVTCGEIAIYASYLPAGACSNFISDLLDDPLGEESLCCVSDPISRGMKREGKICKLISFSMLALMFGSLFTL